MTQTHGAFKTPTAIGQSNAWIIALNYKVRHKKLPVGIFADAGFNPMLTINYDAGVYFPIITNIVEVYVPLVFSETIATANSTNGLKTKDLVRFQFDINKINPVELIRRFDIP